MEAIEKKQYVHKDMIIADVLRKYPQVAGVMLEHGLHCVGCHANVHDTIEAGCAIHGMDEDAVVKLVDHMNTFIAEQGEPQKTEPAKEGVTITQKAADKVKTLLASETTEYKGLRVRVNPGGCSGFVYEMSFEENSEEGDIIVEDKGVQLFIDKESMELLNGADIDFIDSLNESGFKINNPNAQQNCGCGKSFG